MLLPQASQQVGAEPTLRTRRGAQSTEETEQSSQDELKGPQRQPQTLQHPPALHLSARPAYLSGMKREEWVAPIPGRPCFTGL